MTLAHMAIEIIAIIGTLACFIAVAQWLRHVLRRAGM